MIRVLFDIDGALVDSERFMAEAAVMMFKELGFIVKSEDFHPFRHRRKKILRLRALGMELRAQHMGYIRYN